MGRKERVNRNSNAPLYSVSVTDLYPLIKFYHLLLSPGPKSLPLGQDREYKLI